MTSVTLDSALASLPWLDTRAGLIRFISAHASLPAVFKTAALALALISDADYVRLRNTFVEILLALNESERGRKLLLDMNVDGLLYASVSNRRE